MVNNIIISISGPSGSGKSSLLRWLEKNGFANRIVTCTSRKKRKNERNDIDYHFVDKEVFSKHKNDFIAIDEFAGNYYGVRITDVDKSLAANEFSAIVLEPNGAQEIKEIYGSYVIRIYIGIDKDKAYAHLVKRDGKRQATSRQKKDEEAGLYLRNGYDCVISNTGDINNLFDQMHNFIVALRTMKDWRTA